MVFELVLRKHTHLFVKLTRAVFSKNAFVSKAKIITTTDLFKYIENFTSKN